MRPPLRSQLWMTNLHNFRTYHPRGLFAPNLTYFNDIKYILKRIKEKKQQNPINLRKTRQSCFCVENVYRWNFDAAYTGGHALRTGSFIRGHEALCQYRRSRSQNRKLYQGACGAIHEQRSKRQLSKLFGPCLHTSILVFTTSLCIDFA